jgi:hypothetical protein
VQAAADLDDHLVVTAGDGIGMLEIARWGVERCDDGCMQGGSLERLVGNTNHQYGW